MHPIICAAAHLAILRGGFSTRLKNLTLAGFLRTLGCREAHSVHVWTLRESWPGVIGREQRSIYHCFALVQLQPRDPFAGLGNETLPGRLGISATNCGISQRCFLAPCIPDLYLSKRVFSCVCMHARPDSSDWPSPTIPALDRWRVALRCYACMFAIARINAHAISC